ncbi:ATP-binding cassette domain-containing protein [Streptomyces eurythermus]
MFLEFEGCTYAYSRRNLVLKAFDLRLSEGNTVLLGPNGAGKSTLLRLAATVALPQRGTVRFGELLSERRRDRKVWRQRIGYLPQQIKPVPGLRVREQVAYTGWLKGMRRTEAWEASADALGRVHLGALGERPSNALSGGQLRRLGIAQALVHSASVLLLDEPTAGLDLKQRAVFRDLVTELSAEVRFVTATHDSSDLGELYAEVAVIDNGQLRFHDTTDAFLNQAPQDTGPERRAEAAYRLLTASEV